MPSLESEAQAARRQLERVLESPGFSRNEQEALFFGNAERIFRI